MDDLLAAFIFNNYSNDMQDNLHKCCTLLEGFEYKDPYTSLIEIVLDTTNTNSEMIADRLLVEFHQKLNYILEQHQVTLVKETTFVDKLLVCDALYRLMDLEDYTSIITTLESLESNEVKLCVILAEVATVDITRILDILEDFSSDLLDKLKTYIYEKESNKPIEVKDNSIYIQVFNKFIDLYGHDNLGMSLIESGFDIGLPITTYLSFWDIEDMSTDDTQLAKDMLSLIYISQQGYINPIEVFRTELTRLILDINRVSRLEVLVLNMIGQLNEQLKAIKVERSINGSSE